MITQENKEKIMRAVKDILEAVGPKSPRSCRNTETRCKYV